MDAPTHAQRGSDVPRPRRVMTAPVPTPTPSLHRVNSFTQPSKSEDLVETLYNHPCVRIIAFTSSQRGSTATILDNDVSPGSLPPSSRLERTIAVGPFRIYRAPGSVAFLSCGSALQPILPKSQCWCINEDNSRFILQIRRPQYWRIEVPVALPDDVHRALLLRHVFDKILLFEKTPCPFERSFTVRLPDPPKTPIKKKAWTAEGKNLVSSRFESDLSPPAHAPIVISRPRRETSSTRDLSLSSTKVIAIQQDNGEAGSPANHRSIGNDMPGPGEEEHVESTAKMMVENRHSCSDEEDFLVRDLEQITRNDPISRQHAVESSPVVLSDTSPTVTQLLLAPIVGPSDSSLQVQETSQGEAYVESTLSELILAESAQVEWMQAELLPVESTSSEAVSSESIQGNLTSLKSSQANSMQVSHLELPDWQLVAETSHISHEHGNLHYPASSKDKTSVSVSKADDEQRTEAYHAPAAAAQTKSVSDDDTIRNLRGPQVSETVKQPASPSRNDVDDFSPPSDEDNAASFEGSGHVAPVNLARKRITRILAGRAFTAPPQLTLVASPPSKWQVQLSVRKNSQPESTQPSAAGSRSPSASTDSFHSVESWHSPITPLLPSPPSSRPVSPYTRDLSHPIERAPAAVSPSPTTSSSDHTATPRQTTKLTPGLELLSDSCDSTESTPRHTQTMVKKMTEELNGTDSRPKVSRVPTSRKRLPNRRRSHAGNLSISRRALSPLPPAANLFTPSPRQTSRSRLAVVRRLPAAIVHKTVEILMSPPGHLVNLMLKVAAKIAAGEWRGLVFGFGEAGEQIPVQWDYYSDGEFSSLSEDEDGYALANGDSNHNNTVPRAGLRRRSRWADDDEHESWEVD